MAFCTLTISDNTDGTVNVRVQSEPPFNASESPLEDTTAQLLMAVAFGAITEAVGDDQHIDKPEDIKA
jgi:hypothetical protein